MMPHPILYRFLTVILSAGALGFNRPAHAEPFAISHSYIAFGAATEIISEKGEVVWKYPAATRDGYSLPNGNLLLTLSKNKEYTGGAVIEVTRDREIVFIYRGTQAEVNTAQALANGNIVLTEAGANPRLLEIDRAGQIVVEFPLRCQTTNPHLQSRMARKLANGNYLVPLLLDRVVREYTPAGKIIWEFKTPDDPKECWPFTAIRIPNGHTVVTLTHGNTIVEVDAAGKIVWQCSNADLPATFNDPCGAQWLPNGNIVVTSYAAKGDAIKLFEINRAKKIVWSRQDGKPHGVHEFQILSTNGNLLDGAVFR
jgi:outer membrane protein assembly factor BamB